MEAWIYIKADNDDEMLANLADAAEHLKNRMKTDQVGMDQMEIETPNYEISVKDR